MPTAARIAALMLLGLLTGCAAQTGAAYPAPDVKCQLGNREPYVPPHHCHAMGGIPLPRAGTRN